MLDESLIYQALKEKAKLKGIFVCDDIQPPAGVEKKLKGVFFARNGEFFIYINPLCTLEERIFTMAHELGHYGLHKDMNMELYLMKGEYYHKIERQANRFAELLIALYKGSVRIKRAYSLSF